ncbi:AntigenB [Echinococcus granulosus]|uniref:AntigenB n=1 Tax=Echinococcus granulosus TaxID=6210 RepID=W6UXV8_ECHGR|nr:AntigenB [Echinococcus granulosus]EUB58399.1 AntigenB [Echinococcus granulosus]
MQVNHAIYASERNGCLISSLHLHYIHHISFTISRFAPNAGSEIKHFFQSDPLGKKLVEVMKEVASVCQMVRKKARMALKQYVRNLLNEAE